MNVSAKILGPAKLAGWRAGLKPGAKRVAVLTGTFDMLQPGNLSAVRLARRHADHVCVVVEPDEVAAQHVGDRPLRPPAERVEFVTHLRDVSAVVSCAPEEMQSCLECLRPYMLVYCPEHADDPLAVTAKEFADREIKVSALPGCFTENILEAIRAGKTPIRLPAVPKNVSCQLPVVSCDSLPPQGLRRTGQDGQRTVVTVNGCFDVLHIGHLRFLAQARAMGDELIVLLNDDESVRNYKGPGRPIFPLEFRSEALSALESVSRVFHFSEDNPLRILSEIRPGIHVKGGTYEPDRADQERKLVESWGGRIEFCPMVEGYSTSKWLATRHERLNVIDREKD